MIRIVFVNDEVNVLQAMRRTLHNMRTERSMEFVASGAAALETLAKLPTDVIVSDMRMPGMDGWQVQTQLLRNLLSSDSLAALVGHVGALPSTPVAFQEIVACLQQPTASVADAARIVGRDVAMTANIMKLVNSAFFGSRHPIATVDRAIAYLGLETLGALVVGHGVFQGGSYSGIAGFSVERLWQHSLQTAVAARAIALNVNQSAAIAEQAFLAGVLHDVGKLVYASRSPVVSDRAASGEDTVAQMQGHHPEVGAYLLGLGNGPDRIVH
jgi:HD-like signal output (HDOD) protein